MGLILAESSQDTSVVLRDHQTSTCVLRSPQLHRKPTETHVGPVTHMQICCRSTCQSWTHQTMSISYTACLSRNNTIHLLSLRKWARDYSDCVSVKMTGCVPGFIVSGDQQAHVIRDRGGPQDLHRPVKKHSGQLWHDLWHMSYSTYKRKKEGWLIRGGGLSFSVKLKDELSC